MNRKDKKSNNPDDKQEVLVQFFLSTLFPEKKGHHRFKKNKNKTTKTQQQAQTFQTGFKVFCTEVYKVLEKKKKN